jgi:uncharacterized protein
MTNAVLSVCLGCNSTDRSDRQAPRGVRRYRGAFIEREVENAGIEGGVELSDDALHRRTGFHIDEQSPIEHAKAVQLPTLVAQVHDDTLTRPSDVQTIYDNIAAADKKLHWIEGTDQRFRGYNTSGSTPN